LIASRHNTRKSLKVQTATPIQPAPSRFISIGPQMAVSRPWCADKSGCVFITNANPPAEDWNAIAENTVLRIRRANVGRDFGAWRDAAAIALQRFGTPQELLLTNDSVLGPFLPLAPLVDAWRAGGDGFLGLTESLGGGAHLQSYVAWSRGKGSWGNA
jgi:lipopolysaccharide biosynthesis protein